MGTAFWIRRFLLVFVFAFIAIAGAQFFLRGRPIEPSITHGLLWAVVAAGIFTATRIYRSRRGQHCAICRDTPEMVADRESA
jgi:hypothetical protein